MAELLGRLVNQLLLYRQDTIETYDAFPPEIEEE